ncbi:MAG TPA: hypothetical protein VFA52_03150 [Candidatus Paceibacterota bacterium]|nr:hypothetical protein [Candidatus Paceibacterota bacterium]
MKQDLGAIFKKLLKFRGSGGKRGPRIGADPYGDWQKTIIIFVVLSILILIWSGYLFWQINRGNIFEASPAQTAGADQSTISKLKQTISTYDAREKHFEDLRQASPSAADPAL